jgi:hypothetical protein
VKACQLAKTAKTAKAADKKAKKRELDLQSTENAKKPTVAEAKKPRLNRLKTKKESVASSRLQKEKSIKCASTSDATVPCLYCGDLYGDSAESWIQCQACNDWAHFGCAGASQNQHSFVCERCT